MKIIRHTDSDYANAIRSFNRRAEASDQVRDVVAGVIKEVRARGDAAVLDFTAKFDGAALTPQTMRVTDAEIAAAAAMTDERTVAALQAAHRNVRAFALASLRKPWSMKNEQGAEVGEVYHPFERVGCYVPGGTAPLVSTAIMTVTFAAAAGVPEIVVCTPCGKDGTVNPGLLTALKLAGATEIYKIGGAQAIAAMAFGTETIRPVVKIVGPGNSYVVEAKRQAFGVISIDLLPGPSHTLPTGGAGKSFPGLMADMFQRRTSIVRLDKESCAKSEPIVRAFSEVEGLDAHGESVAIRLR